VLREEEQSMAAVVVQELELELVLMVDLRFLAAAAAEAALVQQVVLAVLEENLVRTLPVAVVQQELQIMPLLVMVVLVVLETLRKQVQVEVVLV
jgi:hypothetical protein